MKISIIDNNISTIQITIESHYEMRALYILVKFAAHPAFLVITTMIEKFDDIPALGNFCKDHIRENPIKLIFHMLTNRKGYKLKQQHKRELIAACKREICSYNQHLQQFYATEFFTKINLVRPALTLFSDTIYSSHQLSEEEFNASAYIRQREDARLSSIGLYETYCNWQHMIKGFFTLNIHYAPNIIALHELFLALSNEIARDTDMDPTPTISHYGSLPLYRSYHRSVLAPDDIAGVDRRWHDVMVSPSILASSLAIFIGVLMTVCKLIYDTGLRQQLEGDSARLHAIVDNCFTIFTGFTLLIFNNRVNKMKRRLDEDKIDQAILTLVNDVPSYRQLMLESGARYHSTLLTTIALGDREMNVLYEASENQRDDSPLQPLSMEEFERSGHRFFSP